MPESTDTLGSLMDEAVRLAERTACLAEENARTLRELVERGSAASEWREFMTRIGHDDPSERL